MEKIKARALRLANKKVAFVGSVNEHNMPNIKAMSVAKHNGLETFYFISNHSEIKTEHYKRNFNACIYFTGGPIYKELILEGIMKIFTGDDVKRFMWSNNYKSLYKDGGIDNSDYCVLQFVTKKGRFHHWFRTEAFEID
jgi:general stress protein 26